jgi:hypothetical protein
MRFTSRSFRRNVSKKTRKAREKRRFKQLKQRTRRYKPKVFFKEFKPVTISFKGGAVIPSANPSTESLVKQGAVITNPMAWDDKLDEVTMK